MLLSLLLYLTIIKAAAGLTAYDCKHPSAQRTVLNTVEPGLCPKPWTDFEQPKLEKIQVVQLGVATRVLGYHCSVRATRRVEFCGHWARPSVSYGSRTSQWNQLEHIDAEACWNAAHKGVLKAMGREWHIRVGEVREETFFTHGDRTLQRGCVPATFITNNVQYTHSVEEATATLKVVQIYGGRKPDASKVQFYGDINEEALYEDETKWLDFKGRIVWKMDEDPRCQDHVSALYMGNAEVYARKGQVGRRDTIVITNREVKGGQHMGLVLGGSARICGKYCHSVDSLDGFAVCFFQHDNPQFPETAFKYVGVDQARDLEAADARARGDHNFLVSQLEIRRHFYKQSQDICDNRRRILQSKLQAISGTQNEHALRDIYGPGYQVVPAGPAAAYIIRCVPVQVTLVSTGNCTNEVPVVVALGSEEGGRTRTEDDQELLSANQTTMFMDPITRNLKRFGTEVPCSQDMPIRWLLDDKWYCSSEKGAYSCTAPEQLEIDYDTVHFNGSFLAGMTGSGLMTKEMQQEVDTYVDVVTNSGAAVARTNNLMVQGADGNTLGSPMSPQDLDGTFDTFQRRLTPEWVHFLLGSYSTTVLWAMTWGSLGLAMIFSACRFLREFHSYGWDGGRTIGRAVLAACGVVLKPLYWFYDNARTGGGGITEGILLPSKKRKDETYAEYHRRNRVLVRDVKARDKVFRLAETLRTKHFPIANTEVEVRPEMTLDEMTERALRLQAKADEYAQMEANEAKAEEYVRLGRSSSAPTPSGYVNNLAATLLGSAGSKGDRKKRGVDNFTVDSSGKK